MSHRSISSSRYSEVRLAKDQAAFIGRFHGCKLQGALAAVEGVDVGFATGCSASTGTLRQGKPRLEQVWNEECWHTRQSSREHLKVRSGCSLRQVTKSRRG